MNHIKEIMINLGFGNITELAKEYRATPIYRDSDNSTVLSVKKDTGYYKKVNEIINKLMMIMNGILFSLLCHLYLLSGLL